MPREAAEDLLAEAGILGRLMTASEACEELGLLQPAVSLQAGEQQHRWLFTSQHKHLSSEEMNILFGHSQAAEDTDEDFFDNIS